MTRAPLGSAPNPNRGRARNPNSEPRGRARNPSIMSRFFALAPIASIDSNSDSPNLYGERRHSAIMQRLRTQPGQLAAATGSLPVPLLGVRRVPNSATQFQSAAQIDSTPRAGRGYPQILNKSIILIPAQKVRKIARRIIRIALASFFMAHIARFSEVSLTSFIAICAGDSNDNSMAWIFQKKYKNLRTQNRPFLWAYSLTRQALHFESTLGRQLTKGQKPCNHARRQTSVIARPDVRLATRKPRCGCRASWTRRSTASLNLRLSVSARRRDESTRSPFHARKGKNVM